jgi:signal transduction histidine kinase
MFVDNITSQILVGVTLLISSGLGLFLVRSVKKEVALREELEIANNNQQALIHFITHQVKGFFTKTKMVFAGILEGDFGAASGQIKEIAQEGLNSDNNAVSMIQNILSASNLKSGTVAYVVAELDFTALVRGIAQDFVETAKNKNLSYNINIADEKIMVMADKIQISQAVKNLIDNSIKYTPSGEVDVSLKKIQSENKDWVLFEVSDTGVGLSDDDKKKLFTEGGKGSEATKTNIESTGYGLFILKTIVENHNGRVWAESAGRGQGSQFYISLPLK